MHIHINAAGGEAKFWMEPVIELAENHGLSARQLNSVKRLVVTNEEKIRKAWREHFES